MTPKEAAERIHGLYVKGCEFPSWVLGEWDAHKMSDTVVFYHKEDSLDTVKRLMREREPCNIGMRRLYDGERLQEAFGWKYGAYRNSTIEDPMPNLAVYCHATVRCDDKGPVNVHVLNLIGCALDSPRNPDTLVYNTKEKVIGFYSRMWLLALEAMKRIGKTKFQIYNVGGGAFAGEYGYSFTKDIFEPAFLPLLQEFKDAGIEIIGYDFTKQRFTGGYIPDILFEPTQDLENTVYVNAWDPFSLIGNGNEMDNSLDGHWGRASNMAVLGWLPTNPLMGFCGV
jgi:hypothetical protein